MKHANIAIFVPQNGCPHQCSFCNQRSITGQQKQPVPQDVFSAAETASESLKGKAVRTEIAFFGGSFTAIRRDDMISLLEAASLCVKRFSFSGIRISTRPDAIDPEILDILCRYGVTTVELGAQSMDDRVLLENGRGHTASQVSTASRLIRERGIALGLQMMTGLPGDSPEGAVETAKSIIALQPSCARIYPTIVMRGTVLAEKYLGGDYSPQNLEEAVSLCSLLLDLFEKNGIPVIRLGLHDTPELRRDMLCGPYHPAFRELCESRRFRGRLEKSIPQNCSSVSVHVNPKDVSRLVGQGKSNLTFFSDRGCILTPVQDQSVPLGAFQLVNSK